MAQSFESPQWWKLILFGIGLYSLETKKIFRASNENKVSNQTQEGVVCVCVKAVCDYKILVYSFLL